MQLKIDAPLQYFTNKGTFEKDTYYRRFKLFLKVNRERQMYKELYIIETGSAFGIAVSNNIHAVRWRSIEWREEQLAGGTLRGTARLGPRTTALPDCDGGLQHHSLQWLICR